jgi:hypothetical protein
MFRQILHTQWMSSRIVVIAVAILALAIPLGSVYYGGDLRGADPYQVSSWLYASRTVGQIIPVVALGLGVLLGLTAWSSDHAGRHVYALSLPLPRWKFVLMRFGSGLVLLSVPVVSLGIGAVIASRAVILPAGIHAYPLQMTLRFGLASIVMFAIFFTISIGTRRAVVFTLGLLGGLVLADILLASFGRHAIVLETAFTMLTTWPGPLAILMSGWALFDV